MKKQLIAFYLDWYNNYLTVTLLAEHQGITNEECLQLIEMGRKYQLEESQLQKQIDARHAARQSDKPIKTINL